MSAISETLSDNGSTASYQVRSGRPTPQPVVCILRGTFGGGTLTLEASSDETNWVALENGAYTGATVVGLDIPKGLYLRGTLAGATAPSLTVEFIRDDDILPS